jgi:16S rRNA G966 N2-methylase RsmD
LDYGGNFQALRDSIATIYLDPPFNSNATCNVGYQGSSGYN